MTFIRKLVDINISVSKWLDRQLLPASFRVDGNSDFSKNVVPAYLAHGMKICDVGGGKQPYVAIDKKKSLGLYVVGIYISRQGLEGAPASSYEKNYVCISRICVASVMAIW